MDPALQSPPQATFGSSGIHNSGGTALYGNSIQNGTFNIVQSSTTDPSEKLKILQHFGPIDPKLEKYRILHSKDRVLAGSSSWVLNSDIFAKWRDGDSGPNLLWIRGDPGKGKTMIFASILDQLLLPDAAHPRQQRPTVAYFLCQRTDSRLNTPEAILRGLIYSLLTNGSPHESQIFGHLNATFIPDLLGGGDGGGNSEGATRVFWGLWTILDNLLQRVDVPVFYFMIDALDEVSTDVTTLLECIVRQPMKTSVRWLITSRNEPRIRELLEYDSDTSSLSLEQNAQHVEKTVEAFIESKVAELRQRKRYPESLAQSVRTHLRANATGTFLWASLVCKQLQTVRLKDTAQVLAAFPPGLQPLYDHMLSKVEKQDNPEDVKACLRLLRMTALAVSPQTLRQVAVFCDVPMEDEECFHEAEDLVERCGSFLSIQQTGSREVHFIHQSCSDFFNSEQGGRIFKRHITLHHLYTAIKCFDVLDQHLRQDLCHLVEQGTSVEAARSDKLPIPEELQYAGKCWALHLAKSKKAWGKESGPLADLLRMPNVRRFFKTSLIHWIELTAWIEFPGVTEIDVLWHLLRNWVANVGERDQRPHDVDFGTLTKSLTHAMAILRKRTALRLNPLQVYQESWLLPIVIETNVREGLWDDSRSWFSVPSWFKTHGIFVPGEDCDSGYGITTASNENFIVTTTSLQYPHVWNVKSGRLQGVLEDDSVGCSFLVEISTDNRYVVVLGDGCHLSAWSVNEMTEVCRAWCTTIAERGFYVSMALSTDNCHISLVNTAGEPLVVDLSDGQKRCQLRRSHFFKPPGPPQAYPACFSSDGVKLMVGFENGSMGIWDLQNMRDAEITQTPSSAALVKAQWSESYLGVGLADGRVLVWDTTLKRFILDTALSNRSVRNLEFHDTRLAVADYEGSVYIWDMTELGEPETWWTWAFQKDRLWTPAGALIAPHTIHEAPYNHNEINDSSPVAIIVTEDGGHTSRPVGGATPPPRSQCALTLPHFSLDENMTQITVAGRPVRALPAPANRCAIINDSTIVVSALQRGLEFIHLDRDEIMQHHSECAWSRGLSKRQRGGSLGCEDGSVLGSDEESSAKRVRSHEPQVSIRMARELGRPDYME